MFSHTTLSLHVSLCVALVTCFPSPTPKKGRAQIQRQTFCLISVPDVNDFGHLALFVKPKKVTTEKNKKRTVIRRKSIDGSFRGSILDSIITEGRDSVSVVHVVLWTPWGLGVGINQILIRGGSARKSNPLPFHLPYWQKRYPFYIPFIEKGTPFTYLLQEVLFSFSCSA